MVNCSRIHFGSHVCHHRHTQILHLFKEFCNDFGAIAVSMADMTGRSGDRIMKMDGDIDRKQAEYGFGEYGFKRQTQ